MPEHHLARKSRLGLFKKITFSLLIYLIISMATIPFIDSVWVGEIPVLATIQLSKTIPATLVRSYYAADLAKKLGISKGSFSPNYRVARRYALLIVYLFPLSALISCYVLFIENKKGIWKYLIALLLLSVLDYFCTLQYAHTPGLTIY